MEATKTQEPCPTCVGTGVIGLTTYRDITGLVKREIPCACQLCSLCRQPLNERLDGYVQHNGRWVHWGCANRDNAIDGAVLSHELAEEAAQE